MNRITWWAALAVISPAAAGMAGWSLYTVATHYSVPWYLAAFTSAVFDGIALACLYQASEAVKANRSALGPISATFALAGVSVYLNLVHARLIHGGTPAGALFAMPTLGVLLLSHFSWSATRANARARRGETPLRAPAFGVLGWTLAREEAAKALKAKAIAHVTAQTPESKPTAHQLLAQEYSKLDPAQAIRITADAHPHLDASEVADLLSRYGITVDAMHVALVLGGTRITVQRVTQSPAQQLPAAPPNGAAPTPVLGPAPHVTPPATIGATAGQGHIAPSKSDLIRDTATRLGPSATARQIAEAVTAQHGITVASADVRTVQSRDRKTAAKRQVQDPMIGKGGGGYA